MSPLYGLLAQAATDPAGLNVGGLIIMIVSVGLVLGLNVFCMLRILVERNRDETAGRTGAVDEQTR